jgi:hypothetical protein
MQGGSRNVGRTLRTQKDDRSGDIAGSSKPLKRNLINQRLHLLLRQGIGHVGLNKPGGNAVHRNAPATYLAGKRAA